MTTTQSVCSFQIVYYAVATYILVLNNNLIIMIILPLQFVHFLLYILKHNCLFIVLFKFSFVEHENFPF